VHEVAEFLSPEWLAELGDAAVRMTVPEAVDELIVEQVVRDGPSGSEVRYSVRFTDGQACVVPGAADDPDVRVITDYETAAALQRGELSAQAALVAGRARLQGPIQHLRGREAALRGLDDAFASVRATTTYR
jgi:hypothetical protein